MRRQHGIEIHEQAWCPPVIRNACTDALRFIATTGGQYRGVAPVLRDALRATRATRIVDLCSGAGGPWPTLLAHLVDEEYRVEELCLTDLHPHAALPPNRVESHGTRVLVYPDSVDARRTPRALEGFRTLFTSFHHFRPAEARQILQDAVDCGQGIGVFEQTQRTPGAIAFMLVLPILAWAIVPFVRPFRWSRVLWTFLIPVVPLVLLFDGIVSCLRTYRIDELEEMIASLDNGSAFVWHVGHARSPLSPLGVLYAVGYSEGTSVISPRVARR